MKNKILNCVAFVFVLLVCVSCGQKEEKTTKKEPGLGKYIYKTNNDVLHTRTSCISLNFVLDEEGGSRAMEFIDTALFVADENSMYCSQCFNDRLYEQAMQISYRNRNNMSSYMR